MFIGLGCYIFTTHFPSKFTFCFLSLSLIELKTIKSLPQNFFSHPTLILTEHQEPGRQSTFQLLKPDQI